MERKLRRRTRYLTRQPELKFISTGCQVLDCVLGGGYPLGRFINIVGDKSTGKTLLAIESCANFAATHEKGHIWYREAEAAFDKGYAASLGLPVERVEFNKDGIYTVEDFFKDLHRCIEASKQSKQPGLYILDSLDALSDAAELERDIDKGSFGASKAKKLSELFRRSVQPLQQSEIALIIISQVRENIGVAFGEKYTRSGGKALDFYASLVLWLAQMKKLTRTAHGLTRVTGVQVKANCKKNKVGAPFKECVFDIKFGHGVDDIAANIAYLDTVGQLNKVGLVKDRITRFLRSIDNLPDEQYRAERKRIAAATKEVWDEVEKEFISTRRKY